MKAPDPGPGKWRTRDERVLVIREMTTEHITNCIRMLERAYQTLCEDLDFGYAYATMFPSDSMAAYYAEAELDAMATTMGTIERAFPKYVELRDELRRRETLSPAPTEAT